MKGESEMLSLLFVHIDAAEAESNQGLKFFSVGHCLDSFLIIRFCGMVENIL